MLASVLHHRDAICCRVVPEMTPGPVIVVRRNAGRNRKERECDDATVVRPWLFLTIAGRGGDRHCGPPPARRRRSRAGGDAYGCGAGGRRATSGPHPFRHL